MRNAVMITMVTLFFAAAGLITGCAGNGDSQSSDTVQEMKKDVTQTAEEIAQQAEGYIEDVSNTSDLEQARDYKDWTKVMTGIRSESHNGAIKDVYVNTAGEDAYLNGNTPLPAGTIIVKENYKNLDGDKGDLASYTIMVKKNEDYDPENNNWKYIKTKPDFSVLNEGKIESCIECHYDAERKDYVFTLGASFDKDDHGHE